MARAEAVERTVARQLRAGDWIPAPLERQVAGDLAVVVGPALSPPPFTDAPLWWRLRRGAAHAAAIRLAAAAGGWDLSAVPEPGTVAGLGDLLAGLAGVAGYLERCWRRYEDLSGFRRDGEPELLAEHPGLVEDLAAAEQLLDGIGLVDVLAVIATGGGDW